eukprot:CAMPEP_0115302298 /NCGR_PEP_ID=MMETSP0270-20121206/70307_1 /TAXON_ID=71861 /ORGANISM="Scrippsiella trochoidea, Strain CCMP3099" /LENGTH=237 /DNA_ID=CAMNT_0002720213 /DNA_START=35 /DNA_END=745 /DNA_ORIENTATION=+
MKLWSIVQNQLQFEKVCAPEWYNKGEECPYGTPTGPPMGTFTWPNEELRYWLHYVAAFYSMMPFLLAVGIPVLFCFTRGMREILAIIFYWLQKVVMHALKHMAAQRRPVGSCLHSCGMPSGHSLDAACFLTWITLEVALCSSLEPKQRALRIGVAGVLLGPIAWSRVFFNDHSVAQISVGTASGIVMGTIWYFVLQLRCTSWLLKAIIANSFVRANYPLDPPKDEAAWPQTESGKFG